MFDIQEYQQHLQNVQAAGTNQQKGDTFEELCQYVFSKLDGVIVEGRDVDLPSEELDIVLWNPQIEICLKPFDYNILLECKNWTKPADSKALDSFIGKIRRRNLKTGIFIAANGVTGDFENANNGEGAIAIIKSALQEGIRVIILTLADLQAIADLDQFRTLIRRRYSGLFVYKLFNN